MTALSSRVSRWLALTAAALVLSGCAPITTDAGSGDTSAGGDSETSSGGTGEACPTIDGWEYFSDSSVTKYPEAGQVYGDGTPITFEAPAEYYATYTLYYVAENGDVLQNAGGGFSQEAPEGVFTTDLPAFGDEANNRPGILELETVYHDGMKLDTMLDTYQDGVSTVVLGRYCLSLRVNP